MQKKIVKKVIVSGIPKEILLNVNVPYCKKEEVKGVRITRQGSQYFVDEFEERIDPRNGNYFWIKGEMIDEDNSIEFDGMAIKENYVSITPIHYKLTHEPFLNDLKNQYSDE